jgi:hypothetical protein
VSTGRPPGTSLPPARPPGAPVSPGTPVFVPGKASVARPAADTSRVEPARLDATRMDTPPVRDGEPTADKGKGIPGTHGGARETTGQRGERATSTPASVSANGALARGTRGVYGTIPSPEAAADLARRSPEASVTAPGLERPIESPGADPSRGTGSIKPEAAPGGPITDASDTAEPSPAPESTGSPATEAKDESPAQSEPANAASARIETDSANDETRPAGPTPAAAERSPTAPAEAPRPERTDRQAEPTPESSGPLTTGKVARSNKPAVGARAGVHGSKSARKKGRTPRNAPKPPSAAVVEPTTANADTVQPATAKAQAAEPTTAEPAAPATAEPAAPATAEPAESSTAKSAAAEPAMEDAATAEPATAKAEAAKRTEANAEPATKVEPAVAEPAKAVTGAAQTATGQPAAGQREQAVSGLREQADAPPRKRVAAATATGRKVTTAAVDAPASSGSVNADSADVPAARSRPANNFAAPSRPAWQPMTVPPREELKRGVTIFGTTLTRRQTAIGAALLVLLLLLVFLVPRAFGDGDKPNAGADPTVAPTGSAASTGKASSAAAPPPAASTAPPTSAAASSAPPKTSAAASALPAGWYRYTDRSGFSVPLPDGVRPTGKTSELRFRWNNRLLIIAQTGKPQPDPYKDWQQQERDRAGDQYRNYRRIKLERVDYFQSAADWEFTYTTENGNGQHAVKRNFLTSDTQAYSINWYTTPGDWNAAKNDLQVIYQGFKPRK